MNEYRLTSDEAIILLEVLLGHDAITLDPDYNDREKLNFILDKLRILLADISEE